MRVLLQQKDARKEAQKSSTGGNVQGHRVGWGIQKDRPRGQVVGIFMLRPTNIHVYAPVSDSLRASSAGRPARDGEHPEQNKQRKRPMKHSAMQCSAVLLPVDCVAGIISFNPNQRDRASACHLPVQSSSSCQTEVTHYLGIKYFLAALLSSWSLYQNLQYLKSRE